MDNSRAYRVKRIVQAYSEEDQLQPAEERIRDELEGLLPSARMLDLGVGGGRTTGNFSGRVREYIGGDLSASMVDACRDRFGEAEERTFLVLDATNLEQFPDGRFDLVLFSFNGVDEVPEDARAQVLSEVFRVLSPNGVFVFSSHNLQTLPRLYRVTPCRGWRRCLKRFVKVALLYLVNGHPGRYRGQSSARINDGVHRFRLRLHYVAPAAQFCQLRELGYGDIRAYRSESGELVDEADLPIVDDPWVYYLCRKPEG